MTDNGLDPTPTENDDTGFSAAVVTAISEMKDDTVDVSALVAPLCENPVARDPVFDGSVGRTMFDMPGAEDGTITAVIHHDHLDSVPGQSLVRITSVHDARPGLASGALTTRKFLASALVKM